MSEDVDKKSEKVDGEIDPGQIEELSAEEFDSSEIDVEVVDNETEPVEVQSEEKIESPTSVDESKTIDSESSQVQVEDIKMIDNKTEEENIDKFESEKLSDISTKKEVDLVENSNAGERPTEKVDNLSSIEDPKTFGGDEKLQKTAIDNIGK